MRRLSFLILALIAACAPQHRLPQPTTPELHPIRNEAVFVGDLHGEALLFDLRRDDLDGGPVAAIDIERPRPAHVLIIEITSDGPFLLEGQDIHGARFRYPADASDRLILPARRGRIEIHLSPRGEGFTRIRGVARYTEDRPPQDESKPIPHHPRGRVDAEPLPSPLRNRP